jgi:hypothetical protein
MKSKMNSLYQKYGDRFLKEMQEEGGYTPSLKASILEIGTIVEDQLEFIRIYLGHMLLDGKTPENMKRIKRFLSMQGGKNDHGRMEIRFLGGNPLEVYVLVDNLHDIDIADVLGITDFKMIHVYLRDGTKWSQKSAMAFLAAVNDDLAFDGMKATLDFGYKNDLLAIKCNVD